MEGTPGPAEAGPLAERAYGRLIAMLREGELASGEFVSMPALVDDQEGARRLVAGDGLPAEARAALRRAHEAILAEARAGVSGDLPERAKDVDLTLHDALATGLDNPLAREVYMVNRNRVAVVQNTRPFLADRVVSAMEEHLAILDALERRDAEAAVAAIAHHYRTTLRWWGVGG